MRKAFKLSAVLLCVLTILPTTGASGRDLDNESGMASNIAAGVPLKEKFSYGSEQTADEYVRFLKYPYYSAMSEEYDSQGYKPANGTAVRAEAEHARAADGSKLKLERQVGGESAPVLMWEEETAWTEWDFTVTAEGLYNIEMAYYLLPGSGNSAKRSLTVDGAVPFLEASSIVFPRKWKDQGEVVVNSLGDEIRPGQVEMPGWSTMRLSDDSGMYDEPFRIYLKPGRHTIRLEYVDQPMAVAYMALAPAQIVPAYEEVKEQYGKAALKPATESLQFEAELQAVEKSDPTIRRESDGDPLVSPSSYKNRKLNVIGGWRWRKGNQSITWEFTAPEDGLYKIGIRQKQTWNDGLPSHRQIEIDGIVPFRELQSYSFNYDSKWRLHTLQDESGNPYQFHLTKGVHRLTMTVKMGPLTPILQSLNEDSLLLSEMIRDIIKIAGSKPDTNYDYEFFTTIPALKTNMETLIHSLQQKYDRIKGMADKVPAMANNLLTIQSQLSHMIDKPFSIASNMNDLYNAQNSLGSWYTSMQTQPLLIDYIKAGGPSESWKDEQSGFFQRLRYSVANFLLSFQKDYDNVGSVMKADTSIKSTINVWIARGMEWAEIIKEMADEEFTPKTGIAVNVNVLPANQLEAGSVNALMLSIASGKAPDVGLGVDSSSPVEFAIRDAVYDLSAFDDFDETIKQFLPNIMIPYKYREGVYALPETMDFSVMFYRKDIVEELGIKLPDTREELYAYALPALHQNGLQFYYPNDFTPFLFQHGGSFYTADGKRSGLDTPEAFRAFQEYTDLFTNYGVPLAADFYNRMRSGEMPLGVGTFATYLQLSVAAPELAGRWGIAPIPGTRRSDGAVDRATGALAGQSAIIMKQSKHPEESWEFLKWWMSTSVQTSFARELEALIGVEARWNTANVEAFSNLSWRRQDLEVIREQWKWAKETPIVLGGYYTGRYVYNAWNSVVVDNANVRDSLEKSVKEINRELRMKQEEYGGYHETK